MLNTGNIFRFDTASFGYHSTTGKKVLIRDFSGEFRPGEFIAIIGRNGTGKSTFLRSLVRLTPLLQGNIYLNDKLLSNYSTSEYARIVSFVSTDLPRTAGMTVYELVALGRFPYTNWLGSLSKSDHNEINRAIESTGLTGLKNRQILMISDGERQRAMIARTLAQNTPVIILDEPTAFLDLPNKYELAGLLSKLAEMGKTIIISTHDTGIALRFPDKLLIIHDNFLSFGSPEDQILKGEFNKIFQIPGFRFSKKTAEIEILQESRKKIGVQGNDEAFVIWTEKALKRAGFSITERNVSEDYVEIIADKNTVFWKLMYNSVSQEFDTIYDLITYIKQS